MNSIQKTLHVLNYLPPAQNERQRQPCRIFQTVFICTVFCWKKLYSDGWFNRQKNVNDLDGNNT